MKKIKSIRVKTVCKNQKVIMKIVLETLAKQLKVKKSKFLAKHLHIVS